MGAVGKTDGSGCAADFLHRYAVLEIAHPGTAIFGTDGNAEHAQLAELGPEVHGERVRAIDLCRPRRDFIGGKPPHRIAQHFRGVAEVEIEAGEIVRCHGRTLGFAPCPDLDAPAELYTRQAIDGAVVARRVSDRGGSAYDGPGPRSPIDNPAINQQI